MRTRQLQLTCVDAPPYKSGHNRRYEESNTRSHYPGNTQCAFSTACFLCMRSSSNRSRPWRCGCSTNVNAHMQTQSSYCALLPFRQYAMLFLALFVVLDFARAASSSSSYCSCSVSGSIVSSCRTGCSGTAYLWYDSVKRIDFSDSAISAIAEGKMCLRRTSKWLPLVNTLRW